MSSAFENVEPLRRLDLPRTEELACKIEDLLLEKGVEPGVRLGSKEGLCRCFRVSPGTMNEALRVLETRGLVELRRGAKGGVFAAAASLQPRLDQAAFGVKCDAFALEQCLAVVAQLEPLVAVEATKAAQGETIADLCCLVDRMTHADPSRWFKQRCLFQRRLAEMGSNAVLTRVYAALLRYLEQLFANVVPPHDRSNRQRALAAHRALVVAIASGDAQRAATAAASVAGEWLIPRSFLNGAGNHVHQRDQRNVLKFCLELPE
jgi:GntR family transcriptional repressor for pyruvate dehydrogenase complex